MTEYKTWQIGDVKVTRVLEQEAPLPPEALIANVDADVSTSTPGWCPLHDEGADRALDHALMVESMSETIVVDTCGERGRSRWGGAAPDEFLELEAVVKREQVDYVIAPSTSTTWGGTR